MPPLPQAGSCWLGCMAAGLAAWHMAAWPRLRVMGRPSSCCLRWQTASWLLLNMLQAAGPNLTPRPWGKPWLLQLSSSLARLKSAQRRGAARLRRAHATTRCETLVRAVAPCCCPALRCEQPRGARGVVCRAAGAVTCWLRQPSSCAALHAFCSAVGFDRASLGCCTPWAHVDVGCGGQQKFVPNGDSQCATPAVVQALSRALREEWCGARRGRLPDTRPLRPILGVAAMRSETPLRSCACKRAHR